ncbi:MAG: hypothetical protein JO134_09310 [Xanthobacteraceae bacterium]|nr:hypothetical protein [Xanthobacteraceae bacterium]
MFFEHHEHHSSLYPMPRFFFDLRHEGGLEPDEVGVDLPDVEAAYLEGYRAAIELWTESRREGYRATYRGFEIRDAHDRMVLELPFAEALDFAAEGAQRFQAGVGSIKRGGNPHRARSTDESTR